MITVKKIIRGVKENVMDYDDVQLRIRSATSNDPVGPDMRLLSRIAHDTRNRYIMCTILPLGWTLFHTEGNFLSGKVITQCLESIGSGSPICISHLIW